MRSLLPYGMLIGVVLSPSVAAQVPEPQARTDSFEFRIETQFPGDRLELLASRRARLGVSVIPRPSETDSIGAFVQAIAPNGPAARAGLRSGDIITSLNGHSLVSPRAALDRGESSPGIRLIEIASLIAPGDTVPVEFRRGAGRRTVLIVAGDDPALAWVSPEGFWGYVAGDNPVEAMRSAEGGMRRTFVSGRGTRDTLQVRLETLPPGFARERLPPPMMFMMGSPLADLELAPMNPGLGRYFGTAVGILVISAPGESHLGLKAGDVVLRVNGRTLAGPAHFLRILRSYDYDEAIKLDIVRMKKHQSILGRIGEQ